MSKPSPLSSRATLGAFAALTMAATAMPAAALPAASAPASAASMAWAPRAMDVSASEVAQDRRHRNYRYDRGYYGQRGYYRGSNSRVYYGEPVYRNTRVWRGRDGRYYCRKQNGTTGLIIGGAVGALLGREIDGGYDRTLGTILGAAGGALLGREIDRGGSRCR